MWPEQRLSDLCVPTDQRDPRRAPTSTFRYVDIAGIDRVAKTIKPPLVLQGAEAPSRARKVIRGGDVLVSTVRPNLNAVALVPKELDGEIASTGFCVLRANRQVLEPRFLYYRVTAPDFVAELSSKVRGASYPAVSDRDVKNLKIAIPSVSEQRRIVSLLDQANHVRQLRSDADDKAERVLPVILTRVLGPSEAWLGDSDCEPLGTLVSFVSGATPPKSVEGFWQGDVPWVSPKDMKTDFLSDSQDHVSGAAVQETNLRLIERGSALVVVRGMILARTVPLAINLSPVTINQDMKALLPKREPITGTYLWAALTVAKRQLGSLVRTAGHGTRKLDTPDLMRFRIPLPSADQIEQVSSMAEAHRRLVENRQKGALAMNRLFRLLLSRAFSGSLTSAWRERETAELLKKSSRNHGCAGNMEGVA